MNPKAGPMVFPYTVECREIQALIQGNEYCFEISLNQHEHLNQMFIACTQSNLNHLDQVAFGIRDVIDIPIVQMNFEMFYLQSLFDWKFSRLLSSLADLPSQHKILPINLDFFKAQDADLYNFHSLMEDLNPENQLPFEKTLTSLSKRYKEFYCKLTVKAQVDFKFYIQVIETKVDDLT